MSIKNNVCVYPLIKQAHVKYYLALKKFEPWYKDLAYSYNKIKCSLCFGHSQFIFTNVEGDVVVINMPPSFFGCKKKGRGGEGEGLDLEKHKL